MVINMTLGRATFDRLMLGRVTPDLGCGFACTGLVAAACAKAVAPTSNIIATIDKKVEKRRNMRLLRRRPLLRASRLLVCLPVESLGGQCLG
jgi:hypothetical protein